MPPSTRITKPVGALRAYWQHSTEPTQTAALTLPLLVLYGLGVLLVPSARNGVDFLSTALYLGFASLGPARGLAYVTFYGSLVALNLGLVWWLSRKNRFDVHYFVPLILESAAYAVLTGTVSAQVTHDVAGLLQAVLPRLATARDFGVVDGIIVSAGAGLHEELVFRLLGIGVVARVWLGAGWKLPSVRLVALVVGSSVLFSAVHHVVEPFVFTTFVFRVVAGLMFAALYLLRGFAVAAWTHAIYDVWVIVVLDEG